MTTPISTETNLVGTLQAQISSTQTSNIQILFQRILPDKRTVREEKVNLNSRTELFVIDRENDRYEIIRCTAANRTYDAGTGITTMNVVTRGLPFSTNSLAEVSGNKKLHLANAKVEAATIHTPFALLDDFVNGNVDVPTFTIGLGNHSQIQGYQIDGGGANSVLYGIDTSGNPIIRLEDGSSFIPGAGVGTISGGDGIDVSSSVISADLATNAGLEFDGGTPNKLRAKLDASGGLERNVNGLAIKSGGITGAMIGTGVITSTNIASNTITGGDISSGTITTDKLENGAASPTANQYYGTNGATTKGFFDLPGLPTFAMLSGSKVDFTPEVVNIPHGLGKVPRFIIVHAIGNDHDMDGGDVFSNGFSDGTTNICTWKGLTNSGSNRIPIVQNASYAIYIHTATVGLGGDSLMGFITFNATNVTITFTRSSTDASCSMAYSMFVYA